MQTLLLDNFINKSEADHLINLYEEHKHLSFKFRDVYPLSIFENNLTQAKFLIEKLNAVTAPKEAIVDWIQIVKWPKGSKQALHFDKLSKETVLTSVCYLNDDYEGGQTYFEDSTQFAPKTGRVVFFDGMYHKHGVKQITNKTRYVASAWYKIKL